MVVAKNSNVLFGSEMRIIIIIISKEEQAEKDNKKEKICGSEDPH